MVPLSLLGLPGTLSIAFVVRACQDKFFHQVCRPPPPNQVSLQFSTMSKKIFKFSGKYAYVLSGAGASDGITLSPLNFDPRCIALSDQFMEFRFTKMKVQVHQTGSGVMGVGFTPSIATTSPNSLQTIVDCQNSAIGPNGGVIGWPVPKLVLGRADLCRNGPKWFRRGTAFDDLLEQQGAIYYFTSAGTFASANNCQVLIYWEMECAAPLNPADTVAAPAMHPRLQQRLVELRSEMKRRDEEEIAKIASLDDEPTLPCASSAEPDPVFTKLRDLLLRDGMSVVTKRT